MHGHKCKQLPCTSGTQHQHTYFVLTRMQAQNAGSTEVLYRGGEHVCDTRAAYRETMIFWDYFAGV